MKPSQYFKQPETSEKKSRKKNKKKCHLEPACTDSLLAIKDFILGTNANTNLFCGKAWKDMSHITYFNHGKTGHYADKCPKPKEELDFLVD